MARFLGPSTTNNRVCLTGFETEGLTTAVWPGGETEALMRLERHLERKVRSYNFEQTQCKNLI